MADGGRFTGGAIPMNTVSQVTTNNNAAVSRRAQGKIAYTIPEAVLASGLSRSLLYLAIGRGGFWRWENPLEQCERVD